MNERAIATAALGLIETKFVTQALEWALTNKRPGNEMLQMLSRMWTRPDAAPALHDFVKQNYSRLVDRLPEGSTSDRGTRVISMMHGLCTAEGRQEVQAFFGEKAKTLSGGPRALAQTLERIDLCVARRTAQQEAMTRYLKGRS